jgi:hypothetical protein
MSQRFGPLGRALLDLRPALAAAAQEAYDQWDPDDQFCDVGGGGICDQVAEALGTVIGRALGDVEILEGGQPGDDHAWIVVLAENRSEGYEVDIPPGVYERGSGYRWTKIPDVTLTGEDVIVAPVNVDDFGDEDFDA